MRFAQRGLEPVRASRQEVSAPTGSSLPRRTRIALTAGFFAVVAATALVGPSLNIVIAEEDDRGVYLRLLQHENGGGSRFGGGIGSSVSNPYRTLFEVPLRHVAAPRRAAPKRALAYAPARQPLKFGPFRAGHEPSALKPVVPPSITHISIRNGVNMISGAAPADGAASLSRRSVCVRLCDGFFFPVGDYHGSQDNDAHAAVCAGLCPGAPTRLYVMPSGSDKIEEAVSVRDSRPYTALPVAFRHANKHDETCACRTPEEAMTRSVSLLRDFTLRRGDRVMTNEGFRIFLGGAGLAHRPAEFTLLASARDIGEQERGSLRAMERASGFNLPRLATPKPKASDKPVQMTPAPDRVFTRTDGKAVRLVGPQAMLAQSPALAPP